MLLRLLLFRILMKFESPLGVACNRFVHQCQGTVIQGSTYIVQYCSSSPVGGDANIMTAWMTVTRTARTTWIVIGLTSRYSTINTLAADVPRPDPHSSIPFHQLHPPVKLSARRANNLPHLSARWRSCRPRADGSTLIADTAHIPLFSNQCNYSACIQ